MVVDQISLVVYNFGDSHLSDLDTAGYARACIAVEYCVFADAVMAGFEQGILFGVKAQAGVEIGAAFCGVVATAAW